MNILYVATRYHTNQVPVMHGWHEMGANVMFLVQSQGAIESHDNVQLKTMKPSWFSKFFSWIVRKCYDAVKAERFITKCFIPAPFDLYNTLKSFMPEVVIIRNFRALGIMTFFLCRIAGIRRCVMYTQYPIYGDKKQGGLRNHLAVLVLPSAIFSPILFRGTYREKTHRTGLANYFIPLICDRPLVTRTQYCKEGIIHLLDVGKYREYKNHFLLVEALSRIEHPERFSVTIIGQISNTMEQAYFNRLFSYVQEKHLGQIIRLREHVSFREMDAIYEENDVLVLSSQEPASVSILESMSHGLCVISSVQNGTACYLEEYDCGLVFDARDVNQLSDSLEFISNNPSFIKETGYKAQEVIKKQFLFQNYLSGLNELLQSEYQWQI